MASADPASSDPASSDAASAGILPPMSRRAATTLVFVTSASVLVLEILAGRLLAPYVGVTIETFTGIIGTVLAGISLGSWFGGKAADKNDPTRFLGPLVAAGGVLALLSPTIVRWLGPGLGGSAPGNIVLLAAAGFFAPALVLSAVPPAVVKLQLQTLDETGTIVGRFSAIGTAGAIFGTFFTGFVLVAAFPTRPILLGLGGLLVFIGIALWPRPTNAPAAPIAMLSLAVLAGGLTLAVNGPCDRETAYFCARVEVDPNRPSGRSLRLDTLRHSYVDLDDPTYLEFRYAKDVAAILDSLPAGPLDVLYVGGGGFTFPGYLAATRPGSTALVLEIDPIVVELAEDHLGLGQSDELVVVTGDARIEVDAAPPAAFDLVLGDAFGGPAVPWHLTTKEFVSAIRDRLRPEGIYVLNLIDYPPHGFARAEAATLAAVFEHVTLIGLESHIAGKGGGNFVLAGSHQPLDADAVAEAILARGGSEIVLTGTAVTEFVDGADPLRDDYAPVDQLISRP